MPSKSQEVESLMVLKWILKFMLIFFVTEKKIVYAGVLMTEKSIDNLLKLLIGQPTF